MSRPILAADVMNRSPLTVAPHTPVKALAELFLTDKTDGACVVDDDGHLAGVVTSMDLIFQQKPVHMPSFFAFLDALIPIEGSERTHAELSKIGASAVADLMTIKLHTVGPDAPLSAIAELMVEHHASIIPVVEDGRLLGLIDKQAMLRAAWRDGAAGG